MNMLEENPNEEPGEEHTIAAAPLPGEAQGEEQAIAAAPLPGEAQGEEHTIAVSPSSYAIYTKKVL